CLEGPSRELDPASSRRRGVAYLVLASSAAGALVSMTTILLTVFVAASVSAAAALGQLEVNAGSGAERTTRGAGGGLAGVGFFAVALLVAATATLAPVAGATHLVNGAPTSLTFD